MLPNNYQEVGSNMVKHFKVPDGNQLFLIISSKSFEIFTSAPTIFLNAIFDMSKVPTGYVMYTIHAKYSNLPDKPTILCGKKRVWKELRSILAKGNWSVLNGTGTDRNWSWLEPEMTWTAADRSSMPNKLGITFQIVIISSAKKLWSWAYIR